jgi:hypothetical protein
MHVLEVLSTEAEDGGCITPSVRLSLMLFMRTSRLYHAATMVTALLLCCCIR